MNNDSNKVWIVMGHFDYETSVNLKAFRSEEKARAYVSCVCESEYPPSYGCSVVGMEVEE